MTIAYIAHPISGDVEGNLADLRRILRKINMSCADVVPFCPYYADIVSLDDHIPAERERGIWKASTLKYWVKLKKMLTLQEKEQLVNDLIRENDAVTIAEYLETLKEIEAIQIHTDAVK